MAINEIISRMRTCSARTLTAPLFLLAVILSAQAAAGGDTHAQALEREALARSLATGQTFARDGVSYRHAPEIRAMRADRKEQTAQALPRVGASASDLIDRRGALLYFRRPAQMTTAARVERVNRRALLPVAVNTQTGQLVMLPGSIIAYPRDMAQARQLASDHGLTHAGQFPHLNTAIYEVRPGQDVLAAAQSLAADPRVRLAEPEVVAALNEPF